ncbi:hypothetical protein BB2000_1164 [Proteus mirabilis BB2000]|nr:hypothetical protein BB2000_1164 [Proteus mirabilis BB2000]
MTSAKSVKVKRSTYKLFLSAILSSEHYWCGAL